MGKRYLAVESPVLANDHQKVVERVLHHGAFGVYGYLELLMSGHVVDVGDGTCSNVHRRGLLAHHETALQNDGVRLALGIDLQQIVARQFQLNLLVGDFQRVMDIVRGRSLGKCVVVDRAFVESVEEFTVHQPGRLPAGVAVLDRKSSRSSARWSNSIVIPSGSPSTATGIDRGSQPAKTCRVRMRSLNTPVMVSAAAATMATAVAAIAKAVLREAIPPGSCLWNTDTGWLSRNAGSPETPDRHSAATDAEP